MKKSPLMIVKELHGSKLELANKLIPMLNAPEGVDADEFARSIRTASNKQLLRLLAAEERVKGGFGDKAGLISKIVALKFGEKGNAPYAEKLGSYTSSRLIDLHDSLAK